MKNKLILKTKHIYSQLKFNNFNLDLKLFQNFHCLTWPERLFYILFIRPFWDKDKRFFFEGSWGLRGQLYLRERQALYETILKYQPSHCLEIGTYTGGGSTFFIASAFAKLGQGKLITSESDETLYYKAVNYYKKNLPQLNNFVEFKHTKNPNVFEDEIKKAVGVECFFLDGSDIEKETVDQYLYFAQYFKSGTIMIAHDWNTNKTVSLRPIVLQDENWELLNELKPPQSVGLVIYRRK